MLKAQVSEHCDHGQRHQGGQEGQHEAEGGRGSACRRSAASVSRPSVPPAISARPRFPAPQADSAPERGRVVSSLQRPGQAEVGLPGGEVGPLSLSAPKKSVYAPLRDRVTSWTL